MTTEDLAKLTPEAKRIRIAELCEWRRNGTTATDPNGVKWHGVSSLALICPDYLNDLNAMHEAEWVVIQREQWGHYLLALMQVTDSGNTQVNCIRATAAQRCDAFLLTLG